MNKVEMWVKGKTAGLPRWAWLGIGTGAIVLALYWRSRQQTPEGEVAEESTEPAGTYLGNYNGTESAGGLAAAGLVGPAGGSITPVESPYIPEGLTDIMAQLGEIIQSQGATIAEIVSIKSETPPLTGGGPPSEGNNHEAVGTVDACTPAMRAKSIQAAGEITRLSAEAQAIAAAVAAKKKQYPDWQTRSNVLKWVNEQEKNKSTKQAKRDQLQAEVKKIKAICG